MGMSVQWLRLCTSTAGGAGLTPGWGAKTPHATRHGQKKKGGEGIYIFVCTCMYICLHNLYFLEGCVRNLMGREPLNFPFIPFYTIGLFYTHANVFYNLKKCQQELPFGPFLVFSYFLCEVNLRNVILNGNIKMRKAKETSCTREIADMMEKAQG